MGTSIEREREVMGWKKREKGNQRWRLEMSAIFSARIKVKHNSSAPCGDQKQSSRLAFANTQQFTYPLEAIRACK